MNSLLRCDTHIEVVENGWIVSHNAKQGCVPTQYVFTDPLKFATHMQEWAVLSLKPLEVTGSKDGQV